jgi:hypothetical protein
MMRSFKRIGCLALFVVVALSGCAASEETEAEVEAEAAADYEQNDNQIGTFMGYECTEDCSGHEAGYGWAEENEITDPDDCGGNSESFEEGCRAYAEEEGSISSRGVEGTTSQRIGSSTFHSDGTTSQRIGSTTFRSDGTTSQTIGSTTFHSDGTTSQRIGSSTFHSDGTTSQTIGNSTFHSDGTTCQTIGSSTFCN